MVAPWREVEGAVVLHVDLTPDAEREARTVTLLDDTEKVSCRPFRAVRARREFVLCRAALASASPSAWDVPATLPLNSCTSATKICMPGKSHLPVKLWQSLGRGIYFDDEIKQPGRLPGV